MNFFESRYFNTNRIALFLIGLWSYAKPKWRFIGTFITNANFFSIGISQLINLIFGGIYFSDIKLIAIILSNFLTYFCHIVIYYNNYYNLSKVFVLLVILLPCSISTLVNYSISIILQINNLLERIQRDWYNKEGTKEFEIMKKFAEEGRVYTIIIIIIYLTSIIGISLISIFPVFLDIINPLNETRYRELPYPVVDFIDQQKYFYHLSMLSFMVVLDMSFCGIANYALIAIFIQYMCGMFSVVGNMLENALDSKLIKSDDPNKEAKIYAKIVHSIKYHKEALKFDADFNALFETTYLIMLICAPILVTLGFVRILQDDAFETKNQMETIHSLINVLCNLFFVYGNCYLGQKVIDQSVFVFDKAFSVPWYLLSKRSQILIGFIMMRSIKPSYISLGKFSIMSIKFFASLIQTALSYATVVNSLQ